MSQTQEKTRARIGRVGFVSLGCPKALVDTERIVTELRAEGYIIAADYKEADLVIVNTCAFIDAAVAESLEAITEAMRENGRVIVHGLLGRQDQRRRQQLGQGARAAGDPASPVPTALKRRWRSCTNICRARMSPSMSSCPRRD